MDGKKVSEWKLKGNKISIEISYVVVWDALRESREEWVVANHKMFYGIMITMMCSAVQQWRTYKHDDNNEIRWNKIIKKQN